MEISPELLYLALVNHQADGFGGFFGPFLLAPVAPPQHFLVGHVAHSFKVVYYPFIKAKAPMDESMGHGSSVFAVSGSLCVSYA